MSGADGDGVRDGWVEACAVEDIEPEDVIEVTCGGRTFAVYRSPQDSFHASDPLCTHERASLAASGGRIAAISRSRPTMIVSVWWRAWLQRQNVGSFMFMNEATWYSASLSHDVLNAVPCPLSCQRESVADPYSTP